MRFNFIENDILTFWKIKLTNINNFLSPILIILFSFLLWITLNTLLVGSIWIYLDLLWNNYTISTIIIISIITAFFTKDLIAINFTSPYISFAILLISIIAYYFFGASYAPILELRQDPSVYLFKALNLVNYGTPSQPVTSLAELNEACILSLDGFNVIFNSTILKENRLDLDFFYGTTLLYAFLGTLSMNCFFYAPFIISLLIGYYLLGILNQQLNLLYSLIGVILFFFTPAVLWYGKTPFSEPLALMLFLVATYLLSKKVNNFYSYFILILLAISLYLVRIDMIICLFVVTFIVSTNNWKTGLIVAIVSYMFFVISQDNYYYFDRMSDNTVLLSMVPLLLVSSYCLGLLNAYFEISKKIIRSNFFIGILTPLMLALIFLSFRDNLDLPFQLNYSHGAWQRTYNELNMEKLFLILPEFIVIGGFISLPIIIYKKIVNKNQILFLLPLFLFCSYFLYHIHNSPQLYWSIRRYLYVIIPVLYISFLYLTSIIKPFTRRIVFFMMSIMVINQSLNAKIFPEMQGLDKTAQAFLEQLPDSPNTLILYHRFLKYPISSVVSLGKFDFAPVYDLDDVQIIKEYYKQKNEEKDIVYISYKIEERIVGKMEDVKIEYTRVGENYLELPTSIQNVNHRFFVYNIDSVKDSNSMIDTDEQFVIKTYRRYLKRKADLDGLQQWLIRLKKGEVSREKMEQEFVLSKEYQDRFLKKMPPKKMIYVLYKSVFETTPKKNELENYINIFELNHDYKRIVLQLFSDRKLKNITSE